MVVNADLARRAVVRTDELPWEPMAAAGVQSKTLERFKMGRHHFGTFVLKLSANASLPSLANGGCEDTIVLAGEVSDSGHSHSDGAFIHTPPGGKRTWFSQNGCTLLVKTRPTGEHDRYRVVVDTRHEAWQRGHTLGLSMMTLRELSCSRVVLLRFDAGVHLTAHEHVDGEEFYVLEGSLQDDEGRYDVGTWVRQPPGSSHQVSTTDGCLLWITSGHLTPPLVERGG